MCLNCHIAGWKDFLVKKEGRTKKEHDLFRSLFSKITGKYLQKIWEKGTSSYAQQLQQVAGVIRQNFTVTTLNYTVTRACNLYWNSRDKINSSKSRGSQYMQSGFGNQMSSTAKITYILQQVHL